MSIHKIPFVVLTLVSLSVGCSKNDREEAAKNEDGVSTFRYQPPDMNKYTGKKAATPQQGASTRPEEAAGNTAPSPAPKAPHR